ncbi:DUF6257 family protein [Streptomyces sp. NPDC097619]|uniref:DUF6257 family protein n=1 Tax=Streptomyces sp. NPDC097619 TaxID=3157228 RepID=UPI00332B937B
MDRHDSKSKDRDPQFTAKEVARLTWLTARMAKRHLAGPDIYQSDLERRFDRIVDGAREREKRASQDADKRRR